MSEWDEALERARLRYRRLARHHRRTAPPGPAKVRASDIAPRRLTDGLKPNHKARAVKAIRVDQTDSAVAP